MKIDLTKKERLAVAVGASLALLEVFLLAMTLLKRASKPEETVVYSFWFDLGMFHLIVLFVLAIAALFFGVMKLWEWASE